MQWRGLNLDLKKVKEEDPDHWTLLEGVNVTASTLEQFKESILNWVRKPNPAKPSSLTGQWLVVLADQGDLETADQICDERIKSVHNTTMIPSVSFKSSDARAHLYELFEYGDKFVFLYGETTLLWIESALTHFRKQIRNLAVLNRTLICEGPPPGKPGIRVDLRGAQWVYCREQWDLEQIRSRIAGMTL